MAVIRRIEEARMPASIEERNFRAVINTPRGGVYTIGLIREVNKLDAAGEPIPELRETYPLARQAADIAAETVTVTIGGQAVEVSAGLVMAALPAFFDRWADEDRAAAQAQQEQA